MKKVLIYNYSFFPLSETFVYRQCQAIEGKSEIQLLGNKFENDSHFPLKCEMVQFTQYTGLVDKIFTKILLDWFNLNFFISLFNRKKINAILKSSGISVIHAHFGVSGLGILPFAKKYNIPLVVSFHGIDASPAFLKKQSYNKNLPKLFDYAKKIVIVSPHMIETLNLKKWMQKVELIPYGVDYQVFKPLEERWLKKTLGQDETLRILHSGRLVPKKGVPDLIRVFQELQKQYHNIQLDIIGDGPDLTTCEQLISQSTYPSRIKLHGSQVQSSVLQYMQKADIFVLNSRRDEEGDMEGLPNAICLNLSFLASKVLNCLPMLDTIKLRLRIGINRASFGS